MKKSILIAFLLIGIVSAFVVGCSKKSGDVVDVRADDPEMVEAIAKARETLPEFWGKFEHPATNETDFCLKLKITEGNEVEHFWMAEIERKEGKIKGTISNEPEYVKGVKMNQRMEIPEADISDWMYLRDGKIVGNRTLRVMFKHMSKEEVEQYKKMMVEM